MNKKLHKILLSFIFLITLSDQVWSVTIKPGPQSYEEIQTALIFANPGDTINLDEGIFNFEDGLSLSVDNVTIQGKGMDKTILSFKNQKSGAEGLMVTSNKVILKDFAIEDTIGDAIVVKGAEGISFIRIRTEWTGGPKETNGAYGLYPVQSKDVLIKEVVDLWKKPLQEYFIFYTDSLLNDAQFYIDQNKVKELAKSLQSIIQNNNIISARSVLPVSNSNELPAHLGMRHRAAVGITEESDAIAIIVSEENGHISYAKDGELFSKRTEQQLEQFLNRIFNQIK